MVYQLGLRLYKGNRDEANDFCHEVYLKARAGFHSFAQRSSFATWLYRVALNLGIQDLKKKSRLVFNEELTEETESPFDAEIIDQVKDAGLLKKAIDTLPEIYRIPLILFYYDEFSVKKIASELELKEGTVKCHLSRARNALRNPWRRISEFK